jgi:calcineurin-like phosphoesterase family protein
MTVWFTSDNHFGHYNIIKYCDRPFASVWEMNQAMIERWNSVVSDEDEVYHLGDFLMNPKYLVIAEKLKGKKTLVSGNHDFCWKEVRDGKSGPKCQRVLEAGFQTIVRELLMPMADQLVLLSHYPYRNPNATEETEKYHQYRPENQGQWLLHGHIHTLYKRVKKQINVGVDVWDFTPVHISVIESIIRNADPETSEGHKSLVDTHSPPERD